MRKILSRPRTTVLVGLVTMLTVLIAFAARPTAAPTPKSIVLYTPLLIAGDGKGLLCEVVNVSTTPRTITMDLIGNNGVSLLQQAPVPFVLGPGEAGGGGLIADGSQLIGYCSITFVGSSSLDVRGSLMVNDGAFGGTAQTIASASAY